MKLYANTALIFHQRYLHSRIERMYYTYFGLTEAPFSIAPNPTYLFMTERHQEALAHLYHGIESDAGFVLLTGDVGAGKTTVCRRFLHHLPDNTQVAFILNPYVGRIGLLQAMAKELKIFSRGSESSNLRQLTGNLHEHLLNNHAKGINTVLLVDEAQQIHPAVLEFIRLLTNLETDRQKLLKIILVGQPELNDLLAQPTMVQLSQRITARYHIYPLTITEITHYINHRLQVAGYAQGRVLFSTRRIKQLFAMTKGVPRLINVICDRALLGAYSCSDSTISAKVLDKAFYEVQGNYIAPEGNNNKNLVKKMDKGSVGKSSQFLITLSLTSVLLAGLFWFVSITDIALPHWLSRITTEASLMWQQNNVVDKVNSQQENVAQQSGLINEKRDSNNISRADSKVPLPNFFLGKIERQPIIFYDEPQLALTILLEKNIPQLPTTTKPQKNICGGLVLLLWRCDTVIDESWLVFMQYNRPAVVAVSEGGQKKYLVVLGVDENRVTVVANDGASSRDTAQQYQTTTLSTSMLKSIWADEFTFIWQAPLGFERFVYKNSSPTLIKWLANAFAALDGQESVLANQSFNSLLEQRIRLFQKEYQLKEDGKAGVETLLRLNALLGIAKTLDGHFAIENLPATMEQ